MKKYLLILLLLLSVSCNQSKESHEKKILRISVDADPLTLDPRVGGARKTQIVIGMLFEGLMRLDKDGKPIPGIAERYEMSDDFSSCTFYLRDAYWSNGEPVTAHDFENAWKEVLLPSFDSNHAIAFYPIKHAKAAKEGKIPTSEIGVKALDDKTLFVEFEHPAPFFIELTTNPVYSPVYLKEKSKELVSNGPFVLKDWKQKAGLSLEKNQKYWDKDSIKLDGISVAIVEDANTSLMMYEQDELDIVGDPMSAFPIEAISEMRTKGLLHTIPSGGVFWLVFNTEKIPFNSEKIRRAFSYAIDRNDLVLNLLQGGEIPSTSILPKHLALQNEHYFQDANIEEAKRLLQEGLKELALTESTMPKIQLNYCAALGEKAIAQAIQQQWTKIFNIPIDIIGAERNVYLANAVQGDYQVRSATWYSWMNDPTYSMDYLKTEDRINVSRWKNSNYKDLVELAENETDIHKRSYYFNQAEELIMKEMPLAPIFYHTYKYLKKKGIDGICISDLGQIDFKWIDKGV